MDKQRLEEKITKTVAEIFSLEEPGRHESSEEYKALKTKLAADIWKWCNATFKSNKTSNAGVEIMECIQRSLSSYKGEPAEYMRYIAVALKTEIKRAAAKAKDRKQPIISLPENKRRRINNFLSIAERYGKDIEDTAVQQKIAEEYGCTQKEVSALAQYYKRSFVQSDRIVSKNGEEVSIFDTMIADTYLYGEDSLVQKDELERLLYKIDKTFTAYQERTKPYLSALLTHCLLVELEKLKFDIDNAIKLLQTVTFSKNEISAKIIERFSSTDDEFFTQKDIAAWFNRDKTDASRTLRIFSEKLKKNVNITEN